LGGRARPNASAELREKLPEVNAFVEIAIDGSSQRESVSINEINPNGVVTRHLAGLGPGVAADFLYTNAAGRFRFATVCAKVDATAAWFDFPTSIKTIESFANRRTAARVPWVIPVQWRYAPDGQGYGEFLTASLVDLSRGGASLVVGRELKAGAQVEVRFVLKSKTEPLVELCQVVRAAKIEKSDKNAAGIRFLEVDPADERILVDFVGEQQMLRRDRGVV